jgi:hypothetical protein
MNTKVSMSLSYTLFIHPSQELFLQCIQLNPLNFRYLPYLLYSKRRLYHPSSPNHLYRPYITLSQLFNHVTRRIERCKQRGFLEYDPGDVHGHIAVADDSHVPHMLETQLLIVVEVVIE